MSYSSITHPFNLGAQFVDQKFDMNVYSKESIFSSNIYKDVQSFKVVSTDSLVNGRCYTLYSLEENLSLQRSYFNVFKNVSLQVITTTCCYLEYTFINSNIWPIHKEWPNSEFQSMVNCKSSFLKFRNKIPEIFQINLPKSC
jgi:hypothetical protein